MSLPIRFICTMAMLGPVALAQQTFTTTMPGDVMVGSNLSFQLECNKDASIVLPALLCVVGLVVAFFGYRLYISCIACLGFLTLMAMEAGNGIMWINGHNDKEVEKKLIVALCCLAWGAMGAWLFPKFVQKFERLLGFLLGVVVGVVLVAALTWAASGIVKRIHSRVKEAAMSGEGEADLYESFPYETFQGWELFGFFALCCPVAVHMGHLFKNSLQHALMAASAFGGSVAATKYSLEAMGCPFSDQTVQVAIICALAAVAFPTQVHFNKMVTKQNQQGDGKAKATAVSLDV